MRKQQTGQITERSLYRGRRLVDAVRLLPWLGMVLFLLPALLVPDPQMQAAATSMRLLYFIGIWLVLIVLAFAISRALSRRGDTTDEDQPQKPEIKTGPPW